MVGIGRKRDSRLGGAVLCCVSLLVIAAAAPGFAADLSLKDEPAADIIPFGGSKVDITGYVQGTSDYVFRGLSQTERGPAAQGGADDTDGMWDLGTFLSKLFRDNPGTHLGAV